MKTRSKAIITTNELKNTAALSVLGDCTDPWANYESSSADSAWLFEVIRGLASLRGFGQPRANGRSKRM